jgi:hypothetical protein
MSSESARGDQRSTASVARKFWNQISWTADTEGRMTNGKFLSLQAKLATYLVEWDDNRHMSQAAKEALIKSIAQALPVYVMGVFKLPAGLCDKLTKMIRRFWWGAEKGKHKTHRISWDVLMRPKYHGSIGFRHMRLFNQALLARQAWRLINPLFTITES